MNKSAIESQIIGGINQTINNIRQEDLEVVLEQIATKTGEALSQQDINFAMALEKIEIVQRFVDNPDKILGSQATKHGEIAEQVEVGIINARAALRGLADRATADPDIVGRTVNAPADYLIDGQQVQSKFINGELNSLKHVFEHLKKYEDIGFARGDGSYYHIPKDQFENIMKILNDGELEGRSQRSIEAILREIKKIEQESGQKFSDIVKAANADYGEVQLGKVQETLNNMRTDISNENEQITQGIKDKANADKRTAEIEHQASFGEAAKVAAIGAAVAGGFTLAVDIYKKKKEGKKISEFSAEDWKEIGLDTGKSTLKGGVSGITIYGLTNLTHMSSPCASGLVSASFGVASLIEDYRKGEMSFEDFVESSEVLCVDTGITTIGSIIGQAIIPIPVVGAVVGSVVSNIVLDIAKNYCNEKEMKLLNEYRARVKKELEQLNQEVQAYIEEIVATYHRLGGILAMAFSKNINVELRFQYSQQLALAYGVAQEEILVTEEDIDDFFLK